jgi:hypothetical protein
MPTDRHQLALHTTVKRLLITAGEAVRQAALWDADAATSFCARTIWHACLALRSSTYLLRRSSAGLLTLVIMHTSTVDSRYDGTAITVTPL